MKMFTNKLLVALSVLFVVTTGQNARAQNLQVNFGVTFRNARLAPLWIAEEEGYFKKQGLDVKQVNISGGTQGAQMMISGGVDVSYDDPITCIVATAGGAPVNAILGGTPSLAYLIVGGPNDRATRTKAEMLADDCIGVFILPNKSS